MCFILLMFIVVLDVILYLKLLAFTFLLKILEIYLCLLLVPHVKLVSFLGVHQRQMLFVKMLIYCVW
jgi:hypothetical protein